MVTPPKIIVLCHELYDMQRVYCMSAFSGQVNPTKSKDQESRRQHVSPLVFVKSSTLP